MRKRLKSIVLTVEIQGGLVPVAIIWELQGRIQIYGRVAW